MTDKVVDFFCGAGIASIGLKQTGFKPILGLDLDPWCILSYSANHGTSESCDLTDLDRTACILKKHGVFPSFSGVFWVSAPCQGFSKSNTGRNAGDARNVSMSILLPFLAEKFPKATIIVENVPSIMNGMFSGFRTDLYASIFKARGIVLTDSILSSSVHCASEFGVPQSRKRIVFSIPPKGKRVRPFKMTSIAKKTIRDVIPNGFPDPDPESIPLTKTESAFFKTIPSGGNWRQSLAARPYIKENFSGEAPAEFLRRPSWKGLAPCVMAKPRMWLKSMCPIHPDILRRFTIGESCALQGIPQDYVLAGGLRDRHQQVGNGVPPPMAKAALEFFIE